MAVSDSTRNCLGCAKQIELPPRGRKRLYCTLQCRHKHIHPRQFQSCQWCQAALPEGEQGRFCAEGCRAAHKLERSRQREATRPKRTRSIRKGRAVHCARCFHTVVREVRGAKDAAKYCSRECFFEVVATVAAEVAALRRIAQRARRRRGRTRHLVQPEITALRRIAANARFRRKVRICRGCGGDYMRDYRHKMYCTLACRALAMEETRKRLRGSEAEKAARRRYRSARRAVERGVEADRIDPIQVFHRDRWRCHLCGVKTSPALRGKHLPLSPELDHIISLADGGTHTWGNVACACRACNGRKGARSIGQLGLDLAC